MQIFALHSFTLANYLVLILILTVLNATNGSDTSNLFNLSFSDESKLRLLNRLKDGLLNSLSNYMPNDGLDEHTNQVDLLKKKNLYLEKCILSEDGDENSLEPILIEKIKKSLNSNVFESTLLKWSNNQFNMSENIESEIIDDLMNKLCLDHKTLSSLFDLNSKSTNKNQNWALVLTSQFISNGCNICKRNQIENQVVENVKKAQNRLTMWLSGLIAATIITLSSFGGAVLYPLTKHEHYHKVLMFLLAVAIGTLIGTSIIHLIPHAFGISNTNDYDNQNNAYKWKALVILGGLYSFFIIEQFMTLLGDYKKKNANSKDLDEHDKRLRKLNDDNHEESKDLIKNNRTLLISSNRFLAGSQLDLKSECKDTAEIRGITIKRRKISTMAWIIICSEALHNLLDGLSIGAAFTESFGRGASLSLAIICEEIPHKLGDFAILLTCGMSFKLGLLFNFIASSFIYAGIAIGIALGENFNANQWIYAVAGGMFLYVSVCDMIPELIRNGLEIEKVSILKKNGIISYNSNHSHSHSHSPEENKNDLSSHFSLKIRLRSMLIQNLGLITGFTLMFVLSLYADKIRL